MEVVCLELACRANLDADSLQPYFPLAGISGSKMQEANATECRE